MNRTRRKAAKMFRRKYGKATNPFWQAQGLQPNTKDLDTALRAAWDACLLRVVMRNGSTITFSPDTARDPYASSALKFIQVDSDPTEK